MRAGVSNRWSAYSPNLLVFIPLSGPCHTRIDTVYGAHTAQVNAIESAMHQTMLTLDVANHRRRYQARVDAHESLSRRPSSNCS
jgi:hypothetical protein